MKHTQIVGWLSVYALTALTGMAQVTAPGQAAPAFTLADLDGRPHALETYTGKYVVLEWTNYDCPFVKKHYETGNMPALQKQVADDQGVWLSICSSAPGKQGHFTNAQWAERMAAVKAVPHAVLLDPDGAVGRSYGAKNTPHLFVINPEGVVIYAGAIDNQPGLDRATMGQAVNYVVQALTEARAGKPVSVPATAPYGCSVKY